MYHNVHSPVAGLAEAPVKSPGLCSIKYFRHEDVLVWPTVDPLTGVLNSSLSLRSGSYIYLCESANPSRVFTENQKEANGGSYFEMTGKASLIGSDASHPLTLGTMIHHQWGLLVSDKNGVTRLIGNEDTGAEIIVDYTSGQGSESRKSEITWKWQHPQPAPIYTAGAFNIVLGGLTITAGCVRFIKRFEVGAVGAPMVQGDTLFIDTNLVNKKALVIVDGLALPVDDLTGAINWTGSVQRHVEKAVASNTINFVGSVVTDEIVEIYAFT